MLTSSCIFRSPTRMENVFEKHGDGTVREVKRLASFIFSWQSIQSSKVHCGFRATFVPFPFRCSKIHGGIYVLRLGSLERVSHATVVHGVLDDEDDAIELPSVG